LVSRKALVLLCVSILILFQISILGKSFLRKWNPGNQTSSQGNRMVGLAVCKPEYMDASVALWNKVHKVGCLYARQTIIQDSTRKKTVYT